MAHFIHYVSRTVKMRIPKPDGETTAPADAFETPVEHVTGSVSGTVGKVRVRDIIWLVSQLKTPWGTLPPAIDARIEVAAIKRDAHSTGFVADVARSGWAPLCDATLLLREARVAGRSNTNGKLWADQARPIGQYLQGMRDLLDGERFEHWYRSVVDNAIEFVSYRQLDGTAAAFCHVADRLRTGKAVFWDRWSLPRGVAERREMASAKLLDPYLRKAIDRAAVVWGIDSPRYGEEASYSACEKQYAGKRLVMVPRCRAG